MRIVQLLLGGALGLVALQLQAATPAISAGNQHAVILKADGTVWTTGPLNFQAGFPVSPVPVPSLSGVVAISAGYFDNSFALKADGSLWAWGRQTSGTLGNGQFGYDIVPTPQSVQGLPPMASISCVGHCVALDRDGAVWAWGSNSEGQLGDGSTVYRATPVRVVGLPRIVVAKAAGAHSLAIDSSGAVWGWGTNNVGELGAPSGTGPVLVPRLVQGLTGIADVAGGSTNTLALKPDGSVLALGWNVFGQLGNPLTASGASTPIAVPGLPPIAAISGNADHFMALARDGTAWSWGLNSNGASGSGNVADGFIATPVRVAGLANLVAIGCGHDFGYAIDAGGSVFAWGNNARAQLGDNTLVTRAAPVRMAGPGGTGFLNVLSPQSAGNQIPIGRATASPLKGTAPLVVNVDAGATSDPDGSIASYRWQVDGGASATGATASFRFDDAGTYWITLLITDNAGASTLMFWQVVVASSVTSIQTAPKIAAACNTVGGVRSDGRLNTWGSINTLGRTYSGSTSSPILLDNISRVVSLAFGFGHALAVLDDGSVFGWGQNPVGQVGDGSTNDHATPVRATGVSNAVGVAGGFAHSLAATQDGRVFAWGSSGRGQLGSGALTDSPIPAAVPGLTGVRAVAAGDYFSVALKSDGTVWAWGDNSNGHLGDGTSVNRASPVQVSGLAGISKVWCGGGNCLALAGDGSVWGWGDSNGVAFGRPPATQDFVPFRIAALSGFTSFAIGAASAAGIDASGQVWTWGLNPTMLFGDGTTGAHPTPTKIAGIGRAVGIAMPGCARGVVVLRADGTLLAWGNNDSGAVGDGTLARRTTPVAVVNETLDGVLDLAPEVPNDGVAAGKAPPFYTQASSAGDLTAQFITVTNLTRYRPADVGTTASTFVFALAPATLVKAAEDGSAPFVVGKAAPAGGAKEATVACVLAQLNSSGQLQAVSASSIQAYVTGVLSAQGQAVTVVNGASSLSIGGATFYVGYGTSASTMLNSGLTRSVVSVPGTRECKPQAPQTGWWWNAAEGGRGYSIETQGNNLFMAAYLYDASGRATWHVAAGPTSLDGSIFNGQLLTFGSGVTLTGAYRPNARLPDAGPVTLAFDDATHGTLVWPGGTVALQRYAFGANGVDTPAISGQPDSGWWWGGERDNGRGFFIEWQGSRAFMAGYMYDAQGIATWYVAESPVTNPQAFAGSWLQFANGQPMTGGYKAPNLANGNVAPVTIQFQGADTALLTLPSGTLPLTRFRF